MKREDEVATKPIDAKGRDVVKRPMLRTFFGSPSGWIGTFIITCFIAIAVIGPHLFDARAVHLNVLNAYQGPTSSHILGTNALGQDVFARLMVATRLTLELAIGAAAVGLLVGVTIGGTAIICPPKIRGFLLRTIDTLLCFPTILIAIFLITIIGPGPTGAVVGVGIGEAFYFSRISSSLGLSIAEREYVQAARVTGVRGVKLLVRYILPNIFETLIIAASSAVSECVVTIAALSFLGLGVQFPDYDWGRLLTDGVTGIDLQPWGAVGPALAIAFLAMGFGLIGEALARASNPRLWTSELRRGRIARNRFRQTSNVVEL